ncbi:MAG: putative transcriptional regulator/toxin [Candidatus Tokpelaia sp. JSC189]|nr:MAG: putative transcriptional regulator/toxin [Candidatus Tokpelaia sp. JSC189]
MNIDLKKLERIARAKRLVQARKEAGFTGPTSVANMLDINVNNYKAHEAGRNGFEAVDGKRYAKAFNVSLKWLMLGEGPSHDLSEKVVTVQPVPIISWASAGEMTGQKPITDTSDFPTIDAINLPEGEWIALRVDVSSMNKISPPDSIIFVNIRDRLLVSNGYYIIVDGTGKATYKRYRPKQTPPWQSVSYEKIEPPKLEGTIKVIGRVRRSVIDM